MLHNLFYIAWIVVMVIWFLGMLGVMAINYGWLAFIAVAILGLAIIIRFPPSITQNNPK